MIIILFGPPGAGKGTQASFIENQFNLVHISTGDILRDAVKNKTDLGLIAKDVMEKGDLVSDDLLLNLIENRINNSTEVDFKNFNLFIFFPYNINYKWCNSWY